MDDTMVTIDGVSKFFDDKPALVDIHAQIERGDIIGVLGKNGAGKTTLLDVLLGFSPPSRGACRIFGEDSMAMSMRSKARIGFVPQQDELPGMITGRQEIAICAALHLRWDRALIDRLLREWEVPAEKPIFELSVGERQKLSVLLALGHHPDLLVLDEPVASLDPIARRGFLRELLVAADNPQRAIIFSSHIVSDLERIANKVWILKHGRLYWQGPLDALKESVVRLHVRGHAPLTQGPGIPNTLSYKAEGGTAVIAVANWNGGGERLAQELNAEVEVEPLGLEEIFIEIHK